MEKLFYNIFWTANAPDFNHAILESSCKVLSKKVKIETLQPPA